MAVLPIKDVTISITPRPVEQDGFNLSLILGDSSVLTATGRVAVYDNTEDMIKAGFTADMPEYKAAELFFAQETKPPRVAVGFWDSAKETLAEAIAACRTENLEWWGVVPIGKTETSGEVTPVSAEELLEAAQTVESSQRTAMICALADFEFLEKLHESKFSRTMGIFSNDVNKAIAALGYAMGANTGEANSAFTLKFKKFVDVSPDNLTEPQVSDAEAVFGNVYVNRGAVYKMFEQGTMADGTWFDELFFTDMLVNNLELAIMDVFTTTPKVPQTEAGVATITTALIPELQNAVTIGFLAPGIWTGPDFMSLSEGDAIEEGFLIMTDTIAEQSVADREARICPNVYIALKLAGSMHSVIIQLNINR